MREEGARRKEEGRLTERRSEGARGGGQEGHSRPPRRMPADTEPPSPAWSHAAAGRAAGTLAPPPAKGARPGKEEGVEEATEVEESREEEAREEEGGEYGVDGGATRHNSAVPLAASGPGCSPGRRGRNCHPEKRIVYFTCPCPRTPNFGAPPGMEP